MQRRPRLPLTRTGRSPTRRSPPPPTTHTVGAIPYHTSATPVSQDSPYAPHRYRHQPVTPSTPPPYLHTHPPRPPQRPRNTTTAMHKTTLMQPKQHRNPLQPASRDTFCDAHHGHSPDLCRKKNPPPSSHTLPAPIRRNRSPHTTASGERSLTARSPRPAPTPTRHPPRVPRAGAGACAARAWASGAGARAGAGRAFRDGACGAGDAPSFPCRPVPQRRAPQRDGACLAHGPAPSRYT